MLVRIMERDPLVRNSHAGSQNAVGSKAGTFTVADRPRLLALDSGLSVLGSRFLALGSGLSALNSIMISTLDARYVKPMFAQL